MSELKENVYNQITPDLIPLYFKTSFPVKISTPVYGGFFAVTSYNWQNLRTWLVELAELLNTEMLSNDVKCQIVSYFLSRY